MRNGFFILSFLLLATLLNAQEAPTHTFYLLGDAGKLDEGQARVYRLLRQQMSETGENSTVLFLGDNIYPQGMSGELAPSRAATEDVANAHIELVKEFEGNKLFIPGNHDWAQGRKKGWTNLLNQEIYLENHLDSANIFLPTGGCPGPVEVDISEEIALIILDTQWFLHFWSKPDDEQGGCDSADPLEVLQLLDGMIRQNSHKRVVVATHHPMITYGSHGGYFPTKAHFLPPILGSIHPLYRKYVGSPQDLTNPRNAAVADAMKLIFEKYPNTMHVAGHEHSMQYSWKDSIHYIVSGAIAKNTFVRQKGYAEYAESAYGFGRLDFYADGSVILTFWKPGIKPEGDQVAFKKTLMKKPFVEPDIAPDYGQPLDFSDSSVMSQASYQYDAKRLHGKLLGHNYRDVWKQKIKVPLFDIGEEKGGLKIVQRGGGMQTKSLRLEAEDGKQYVLRSIEKYPENAVPEFLRNTFAVDLVQDQISAAHPYGAFVIPPMAEAAGIYHTNPKLVYIPEDPRFGEHMEDFAATMALFEERPAKDWSEADFFGNSPDIESTAKVIEELEEDNDNEVDQKWVLKSRLFDMVIGDWDRHDDQWRWSERDKKGKGKRYRPIPRDRDQAFFINQGLFPEVWSRKWALPKFEGFDYKVDWVPGFMYNARYFDRSFLNGLSENEWLDITQSLQDSLSDAAIENAIKQWPQPVFELGGEEIIEKLKARRDSLQAYAKDYYKFLAREVNVVGSNKHEHFAVTRKENGDVLVVVHKIKKDGEKKKVIYQRLFKHKETKEIRLYGLDGQDVFEITGKTAKSIRVRVIGGADEDSLVDKSHVAGFDKKTMFYDTEKGNTVSFGEEASNKLSNDEAVNFYNRQSFKYNLLAPLLTANYNIDDGIFLGGGMMYTTHGFRKEPFKNKHRLLGSYAFNTQAFNINYKGRYTDIWGNWDGQLDVSWTVPEVTNNFFGLGNETVFDQEIDETTNVDHSIDYYRLRFEEFAFNAGLYTDIGPYGRVGGQANYYYWRSEKIGDQDRFVKDYVQQEGLDVGDLDFNYIGASVNLEVDTRKDKVVPKAGILWKNEFNTFYSLESESEDFHQFNTSASFYLSFRLPARFTVATRVGYGANLGEYPFFKGQTLGGIQQIRGYRKTRFYGDQTFYNNLEVRMRLVSIKTYLFPAAIGILGFHDIGRVWLEGENSDKWHRGVGGGVWFTPFNMAALSAEVGHSEEETLFYLRLGFLF